MGGISKTVQVKVQNKRKAIRFYTPGQGSLAVLKHYTGLSDKRLLEGINADYQFQFFCGIDVQVERPMTNFKIISEVRAEMSKCLDILSLQKVLAENWKPYIETPKIILEDATFCESWIRYPTNVKLLWESNEWVYKLIKQVNKIIKSRMPRSKFAEQKSKYMAYSRTRKKIQKKNQKTHKEPHLSFGKNNWIS